jgi:hypothetical protein
MALPSPSCRSCRLVGGAGSSSVVLLSFSSPLSRLWAGPQRWCRCGMVGVVEDGG